MNPFVKNFYKNRQALELSGFLQQLKMVTLRILAPSIYRKTHLYNTILYAKSNKNLVIEIFKVVKWLFPSSFLVLCSIHWFRSLSVWLLYVSYANYWECYS